MTMNNLYGKSAIIFFVFIVSDAAVGVSRAKFGNEAKIEESDVKQGGTTPAAISPRFLDLGGVISQLFSGFNQGSGGGSGGGLNLPPNSQFYPGVPAQSGNLQPTTGQGNYLFPNQGNNQQAGIQNQQQWNQPNQNAFNSNNNLQPTQQQGWQNYGQNQNSNPNPPQGSQNQGFQNQGFQNQGYQNQGSQNQVPQNQGSQNQGFQNQGFQNQGYQIQRPQNQVFQNQGSQNQGFQNQGYQNQGPQNQGSQTSGRLTTVPWYPNQVNVHNNGANHMLTNEGTLDDFFSKDDVTTTKYDNGDDKLVYPESNESVESSSKTAIWGKKVSVPSTTSTDNIVFYDSRETSSKKECVQNCPTTSEYAPVCGTDDVTYFNPGRLLCARNCGMHVFEARRGSCKAKGRYNT